LVLAASVDEPVNEEVVADGRVGSELSEADLCTRIPDHTEGRVVHRQALVGQCPHFLELTHALYLVDELVGNLLRRIADAVEQEEHLEVHLAPLVPEVRREVSFGNREEVAMLI